MSMRPRPRPRWLPVALALLALPGCASAPRLYVNPEADMTVYQRIAVLPLANLTSDRFAAERVMRSLVTEIILAERFQIVESTEFWTKLQEVGGEPGSDGIIKPDKLKEAAAAAKVQGVLRGAVTEYGTLREGSGEVAQVGFDVELIDAPTGNVVWRTSIHRTGKGRVPLVGGSGTRSVGILTEDACKEVVARLKSEVF
jgi:TolB-like protein